MYACDARSPQRYHAKSLKELKRKFAEVKGDAALRGILSRCGCLDVLEGVQRPPQPQPQPPPPPPPPQQQQQQQPAKL